MFILATLNYFLFLFDLVEIVVVRQTHIVWCSHLICLKEGLRVSQRVGFGLGQRYHTPPTQVMTSKDVKKENIDFD